jgi:hypothetical protein
MRAWSARYEQLREVTHQDVVAHVTTLQGHHRSTTTHALRSLFRWAKRNGVVFADPTRHIKARRAAQPIPQPLAAEQIAPTIQAATSPHARLAIALAGRARRPARRDHPHATRRRGPRQPPADHRRAHQAAGRPHPPTAGRLARLPPPALAEHGQPHLLVTVESALGLGPVTHPWLNRHLRGLPATLERLRVDRQLEEALTNAADPLHLAEVFGLNETTAIRYANAARQLLDTGGEPHPCDHHEPTGPPRREPPDRPSGSS